MMYNGSYANTSLYQGQYWSQHEPLSPFFYIFVGSTITLFGIVGLVGNALVILSFCRSNKLRTISNYFLVNLAVADLSISIFGFPLMAVACFNGDWPVGPFACYWYAVLMGTCAFASICSMALIALDRCIAISLSCTSSSNFSKVVGSKIPPKTARYAIFVVWTYSCLLSIPPLVGWNSYVLDAMAVSCTFDYTSQDIQAQMYIVFIFCMGFAIPLTILITSYIVAYCYLKSHEYLISQHSALSKQNLRRDLRMAKFALYAVFFFSLSWMPYAVIALAASFGNYHVTPFAQAMTAIFAKASAIYNPLIYSMSHPSFQKEMLAMLYTTCPQGFTSVLNCIGPILRPITRCCSEIRRESVGGNYNLEMTRIHIAVNVNVCDGGQHSAETIINEKTEHHSVETIIDTKTETRSKDVNIRVSHERP